MAKHILVVDDDADIRQAAEMVLTSAGYKVSFAASAEEAMQKLQAAGADLVLLDVMMETDTAGFHLAYDIRKDAKLKNTPIVMLTSIEDRLGVKIELGTDGDFLPVNAFLRKPIDAPALKAKIAELLAGK
ncbi:MAG: response regulator [Planctomycetota bacterium]|nr:response regulator [Planctomycetota bacterium]